MDNFFGSLKGLFGNVWLKLYIQVPKNLVHIGFKLLGVSTKIDFEVCPFEPSRVKNQLKLKLQSVIDIVLTPFVMTRQNRNRQRWNSLQVHWLLCSRWFRRCLREVWVKPCLPVTAEAEIDRNSFSTILPEVTQTEVVKRIRRFFLFF